MPVLRNVTWIGGPQDGAVVSVPHEATWVSVLEDRRAPARITPVEGEPPPRALMRYSVPIIDGKIIWSQRVQANPPEGEI